MKSKRERRKIPPSTPSAAPPAQVLPLGIMGGPSSLSWGNVPSPGTSRCFLRPCEMLQLSFLEGYPGTVPSAPLLGLVPVQVCPGDPPKSAPSRTHNLLILRGHTWGCCTLEWGGEVGKDPAGHSLLCTVHFMYLRHGEGVHGSFPKEKFCCSHPGVHG